MLKDSSATAQEQSPHVNETAQNSHVNHTRTSQTPDTHEDEWTSKAGDVNSTGEAAEAYSMRAHKEDSSGPQEIETLVDIICGAGEERAGALLVFLELLENSEEPQALAYTTKHLAFTRCGELNVYGMLDAQIAAIGRELCRN